MSPRRRFLVAAGLAALAAGLAAGCAKRERAAGKPLRVAVVPQGSTHEFWKSIHAGAVKAARDAQAGGTGGGIVGLINGLTITLLRMCRSSRPSACSAWRAGRPSISPGSRRSTPGPPG
ncbi:MAG: hypothetical protein WAU32_00270 [Thermoanaerobaculia bacterium]